MSPRDACGDRLRHVRLRLDEANDFVGRLHRHHRHHRPVVGHLFSLGAVLGDQLVGVAIVGRPVARMRDDGETAEVTRLCTDGTRNACSFLYGAAARAAFALGFKRIGTYILASESGVTLKASGWKLIGETKGGSWSRSSRTRDDKHPTEPKFLFEASVSERPHPWPLTPIHSNGMRGDTMARKQWLEGTNIHWMVCGPNDIWVSTTHSTKRGAIRNWLTQQPADTNDWRYWYRHGYRVRRVKMKFQYL